MNRVFARALGLLTLVSGAASVGCSASASTRISPQSADASARMIVRGEGGSGGGQLRLADDACEGMNLTPETRLLTERDLRAYLDGRGIAYRVTIERDDLHLFDVELHGEKSRLRVATLDTPRDAGRHLHKALLEHGEGYWGVHRGNLAVLGPQAALDELVGFSLETGLACWGVLTTARRDDTFVVPGGYFEF